MSWKDDGKCLLSSELEEKERFRLERAFSWMSKPINGWKSLIESWVRIDLNFKRNLSLDFLFLLKLKFQQNFRFRLRKIPN